MRRVVLVVQALALGACTGATEPNRAPGPKSAILRGSVTGSILDARFEVSNGWLTCAGLYPSYKAKIITVTLTCDDGLSGVALITRRDAFDGGGMVRFSDGSEGTFAFGRDAGRSLPPSAPPSDGLASAAIAR